MRQLTTEPPIREQGVSRQQGASEEHGTSRRHQEILETAAQLICRNGYEATSMQRIADACGLTKAGLYHHVQSKEHLLLEIMSYGMDSFDEQVLSRVAPIADPVQRLRECMQRHIQLVTRGRDKEITIILHEHATLTGASQAEINGRKKRYVRFLESSFAEAVREGRIRRVDPTVAAFSFLGTVNWIYKWFQPDGKVSGKRLATEMPDIFFGGLAVRDRGERSGSAPGGDPQ